MKQQAEVIRLRQGLRRLNYDEPGGYGATGE